MFVCMYKLVCNDNPRLRLDPSLSDLAVKLLGIITKIKYYAPIKTDHQGSSERGACESPHEGGTELNERIVFPATENSGTHPLPPLLTHHIHIYTAM